MRVSPRPSIGFCFDPRRWPKAPAVCCAVLRTLCHAESRCAPQCCLPKLGVLAAISLRSNQRTAKIAMDKRLSGRLQRLVIHAHRPLRMDQKSAIPTDFTTPYGRSFQRKAAITGPIKCIRAAFFVESSREVLSVDGCYRALRETPQVYCMEPLGGLRDTYSRSSWSNTGLRSGAILVSVRR